MREFQQVLHSREIGPQSLDRIFLVFGWGSGTGQIVDLVDLAVPGLANVLNDHF